VTHISVGIDIGGTFTDVVAYDHDRGRSSTAKVSSTPPTLIDGFFLGLKRVIEELDAVPADVFRIVHGTTIATNAVLEEKGAKLGILSTKGFEDILVVGRQRRSEMYNLFLDAESPLFLAPRRRIKGISERVGPEGDVINPLDEQQVKEAVKSLVDEHQIESLAVCYLFSFMNSHHEQLTLKIVGDLYPDLPISLSSTIDPKFREYERLCVTAFDAYVRPIVGQYLKDIESRLSRSEVPIKLEVMQSRGGITGSDTVLDKPVTTILSGPAAGVIGARVIGEESGYSDLITIDIGGTSCDVALVSKGSAIVATEGKIGRYPLRQPMIDVSTIGAGGGSIARIDRAGGLRVGPDSAGSNPGPACYGWGGVFPTVTDASLVLGYLDSKFFAGGALTLKPELAYRSVVEHIAQPLELDPIDAAAGIHRIINSRMADQLRLVSIQKGHDPRKFTLIALGGGGPVHACRLAEQLDIQTVLIPSTPGVLSAFGLLAAPIEHEHSSTIRANAASLSPDRLVEIFGGLDEHCSDKMSRDGVPPEQVVIQWSSDMRYVGQSYELEVPMLTGDHAMSLINAAVEGFHTRHEEVYGYCNRRNEVEFVNLRTVQSSQPEFSVGANILPSHVSADDKPFEHREAYFEELGGMSNIPVYMRDSLRVGREIEGPAIVQQFDTTTLICPNWTATTDRAGNLLLSRVR
jgi:N-methylhydantoinase A